MSEHIVNAIREADLWMNTHRVNDTWRTVNRLRDTLARAEMDIAAQVRARIAADIEAAVSERDKDGLLPDETFTGRTVRLVKAEGMKEAARIARGDS